MDQPAAYGRPHDAADRGATSVPDDRASTKSSDIKDAESLWSEIKGWFPHSEEPLTTVSAVILVALVQWPFILTFALMSASSTTAFAIYWWFVSLHRIGRIFLAVAGGTGLCSYACGLFDCKLLWLKVVVGVGVVYVFAFGGLCYTKEYPSLLLILIYIHLCLYLVGLRAASASRLSAKGFFEGIFIASALACVWVFIAWIAWFIREKMLYNEATRGKLHGRMQRIFDEYGVNSSWDDCAFQRNLSTSSVYSIANSADADILEACSHLEQMTFLIWATPFIMSAAALIVAVAAGARRQVALASAEGQLEDLRINQRVKIMLLVVALAGTALWMGFQQMGASMGLSNLYLSAVLVTVIMGVVWTPFVIDVHILVKMARENVLWKIAKPIFHSDWFFGGLVACGLVPVALFLALDVMVRQVQRLRGVAGRTPWVTNYGYKLWCVIKSKHWTSCLEKAFILCVLYFASMVFAKFTSVFLGFLNDWLATFPNFASVAAVWFIVTLFLMLLPPTPGPPVFISAGTIVANQGKGVLGLVGAVAFATGLTTLLKLVTAFICQMCIGLPFGQLQSVQMMIGVHTGEIRAIENILKKPWNHIKYIWDKVVILIGGPDWPVAVFTGVLRLNPVGIMVGTLPSFFIVLPCVLAGVCLVDSSLKYLSPVIIMLVTTSQGGLLLAAVVAIAQEAEQSQEELSKPKPEHAALIDASEKKAEKTKQYMAEIEWRNLLLSQRLLLFSSVLVGIGACGLVTLRSVNCFEPFEIGNSIDAPISEGGLNGQASNVIKRPEGVFAFALTGVAMLLFLVYRSLWLCNKAENKVERIGELSA